MSQLLVTITMVALVFVPVLRSIPSVAQIGSCVRFAVIGDYGDAGQPAADVAALVADWNPDFIITTGDNNYPSGEAETIDENIGQYYHAFIYPYVGAYGKGAETNRFFPSLGNHDWALGNVDPYLDYFTLPYNERYYDFVWGPVHFFVVDSDLQEPDGRSYNSKQGTWITEQLSASTAPWQIVTMHHPPYSSGPHGSTDVMQWPYKKLGVDAVLAGHDHLYERLLVDELPYVVNGLGGGHTIYEFETPLPESQVRYNEDYGAMNVVACDDQITFEFAARDGRVIDAFALRSDEPPADDVLYLPFVLHTYVGGASHVAQRHPYLRCHSAGSSHHDGAASGCGQGGRG